MQMNEVPSAKVTQLVRNRTRFGLDHVTVSLLPDRNACPWLVPGWEGMLVGHMWEDRGCTAEHCLRLDSTSGILPLLTLMVLEPRPGWQNATESQLYLGSLHLCGPQSTMAIMTCKGTTEISDSPVIQVWKLSPREGKELPDYAYQARFSVAFILAPAWASIW